MFFNIFNIFKKAKYGIRKDLKRNYLNNWENVENNYDQVRLMKTFKKVLFEYF